MNIPNGGYPPLIICYDNIKANDLNKILKNKNKNKNTNIDIKQIVNNKQDTIINDINNSDNLEEV
jgi:hypothetical protein